MSKRNKSTPRICCFCGSSKNNELEFGKFYKQDDIVTHYYCLLLSSNMQQRGNDDEGILGFLATDIRKEIRRGKKLVCSHCKKNGATLGCCDTKCKRIFHYPCGLRAGTLNQFFGEFRSYCMKHRPKQKIDTQVVDELARTNEVVCYICYDPVDPYDIISTMWAPCCKKNAWFHRKCVQQLALSAGYFFKCPLCNDKKIFQKAMLEFGIFIPSQDASWELVPNAFQELLYRHDQCDAKVCLCPKGRKYTSFNAKWELALCRTCGSQGIHMACGELKWGNPVWECTECISILGEGKEPATSSTTSNILQNVSDSEDTESDISVGKDSPIPFSSNFPLTSSTPEVSSIKLRPGPQTFKLRQQFQASREMQNKCKQQTNENTNTLSCPTNIEQHSLQSTSSEEIITNVSLLRSLLTDSTLDDCKNNLHSSTECSKSQQDKLDSNVITVHSDDEDIIEVTNCNSLSDIFIIAEDSKCKINNLSPSKNNTIELNNSSILQDYNTPKIERLSQKSNLNQNNTNNLLINNLSTTETDNLQKFSLQNEIQSDILDTSIELNYETEYNCTDLISNIKITNVVSLAPEEFENTPSIEHEWKINDLKYSMAQNSSELIISDSISQSLSSENDTLESNLKRKLDKTTLTPTASRINETKKIKQNNSVLEKTSESSYTTLPEFTYVACTENNLEIVNSNTSAHVSNLQNRDSQIQVEQDYNIDEGILHTSSTTHLFNTNASTNVLNDETDTFAVLISEKNIKVDSNTKSCDGDAGTSSAAESRNRSFTNDTRINCTEESIKLHNSRSTKSQTSGQWKFQNDVEVPVTKPRTSHKKSNIYLQGKSRNTECNYSRLIPEYIRLRDLKFRVDNTNNLEMILYNKFSVNINMECPTTMKKNTTFDASIKKITQQNICRTQSETSPNFRSANILQSISPVCNKDKSKCMFVNEQSENYRDDTKENLDPVTVSCKNLTDNLLANTTLITNNSDISTNNQSENGNLTRSVSKVIEDNDEGRSHENTSLIDNIESNFDITTNCNNTCSRSVNDIKQGIQNFNSDHMTNSVREIRRIKRNLRSESQDSTKLVRRVLFHENYTNNKPQNHIKNTNENDLKVSIDLKKIKNFVDNNPDLFTKCTEEDNEQCTKQGGFLNERTSIEKNFNLSEHITNSIVEKSKQL